MSSFLLLILIAIVIGLGITTLLVALISQLTDPAARPSKQDREDTH